MIQQNEIRETRKAVGILAKQIARGAGIETGRFSLIESESVTARSDEMERIDAALLKLMSQRLSALRSLEMDKGFKLAEA